MKIEEVFNALHAREDRPTLAQAVARLTDTGFGLIDEKLFRQCLYAVEGLEPGTAPEDPAFSNGNVPAMIERTEAALREAFGFFTVDAGIPHLKLLPYGLALFVTPRHASDCRLPHTLYWTITSSRQMLPVRCGMALTVPRTSGPRRSNGSRRCGRSVSIRG